MNPTDIVTMLNNLSESLGPIRHLILGFSYLIGLIFILNAIIKLKATSDPQSQEKKSEALIYFIVGILLLYINSTIQDLSNTAFGAGSTLGYDTGNPFNILSSITRIVKTVGVIWFIRGCILLTHAGAPEENAATKGLTFICAGILAMNFEASIGALAYIINSLMKL